MDTQDLVGEAGVSAGKFSRSRVPCAGMKSVQD